MLTRKEIKAKGKAAFYARYWLVVGITALFMVICGAIGGFSAIPFLGIAFSAGSIIVVPVLAVGYAGFTVKVNRGIDCSVSDLFDGFKSFGRSLGGMLWMELWVFLWSLLFIVPGIVKSYSYSMTPYILAERPDISATDALRLSMAMTDGHKGKLFVADLSFIGWILLTGLTFGVLGIFYVGPYYPQMHAGYYDELNAEYARKLAAQAAPASAQ